MPKAIVGREGWLFLGNIHNQALAKSTGVLKSSPQNANKWAAAMKSRQDWLAQNGIPMLVFIAPNKHSIYPEHLPSYINISSPNSTDILFNTAKNRGINIYNLRKTLLKEKQNNKEKPLYKKTDSHWNNLGATIAAQEILATINLSTPIQEVTIDSIEPYIITSGDVAKQLRIEKDLPADFDVDFKIITKEKIKNACIETGDPETFKFTGECIPFKGTVVGIHTHPKKSYHPLALNDKKLLFMRDSFGTSVSSILTTAFSVTWQSHHYKMRSPKIFREFVKENKPDVVVFLIVERSLTNGYFNQW